MDSTKLVYLIIPLLISFSIFAQQESLKPISEKPKEASAEKNDKSISDEEEKPNSKRIRRVLNLIVGVEHDEELMIPEKELTYKGRVDFFDMKRIKNTDFFRIFPKKVGNGIVTIHNKITGQTLVELRFDIRNDEIEKTMREVQSLLGDIEGIEFKIVNNLILLDGFALIPKDLIRIAQVIKTIGPDKIKSLVSLNPLSRKKIAEYISRDVNNPEVAISAVGDFIKLEGQVSSPAEKDRIMRLVGLYMPDLVVDKAPETDNITIVGRKAGTKIDEFIIDLISIKKDEEKVEPPPKMVQVVAHFVEFSERYGKSFNFAFNPSLRSIGSAAERQPTGSTISEIANLIDRLIPKLNWAKSHGYARILDTASVLVQDKKGANINRKITTTTLVPDQNGGTKEIAKDASVNLEVTPVIKSERSGLVELGGPLKVSVNDVGSNQTVSSNITTIISVRNMQSAAFGGVIKKKTINSFGNPKPVEAGPIITLNQAKEFDKTSSNFVVFITPIIKSSASAGVDQVKKKFRLKE
ncbi:MAG: hypothetical protein WA160_05235 [Pseudobdellovibrio sp.]